MGLEPSRDGIYFAILKDIDGTATLQIYHDRAIAVSLAPSPIVHTDDVRFGNLWIAQRPHPPEQGRATARQALSGQMTGTSGATQSQTCILRNDTLFP
jgi:hypothetical protein